MDRRMDPYRHPYFEKIIKGKDETQWGGAYT